MDRTAVMFVDAQARESARYYSELAGELRQSAEKVASYLARQQFEGGVADPREGRIIRHSYTTASFAWLATLLAEGPYTRVWQHRARMAVRAELVAIEAERRSQAHPVNFHWEFKNLALLRCERLVSAVAPRYEHRALRRYPGRWSTLDIDLTNWHAMRAVASLSRAQARSSIMDKICAEIELRLVLSAQTTEGLFKDSPKSCSFQYHAYVLWLLRLYLNLAPARSDVKRAFLRGLDLLGSFIDPSGDFNYYGRGQRQLFGYASAIAAFAGGAVLSSDQERCHRYFRHCEQVWSFVKSFVNSDSIPRLTLNDFPEARFGWYEYNLQGDYSSHFGVCLASGASDLSSLQGAPTRSHRVQNAARVHLYSGLGLCTYESTGRYLVFSAGGFNSTESAGLVHTWPNVTPPLGGPSGHPFGNSYTENYVGLKLQPTAVPTPKRTATLGISVTDTGCTVIVDDKQLRSRTQFRIGRSLEIIQRVSGLTSGAPTLLHVVALHAPRSPFAVRTLRPISTAMGPVPAFDIGCAYDPGGQLVASATLDLPGQPGSGHAIRISRPRRLAKARQYLVNRVYKGVWVLNSKLRRARTDLMRLRSR